MAFLEDRIAISVEIDDFLRQPPREKGRVFGVLVVEVVGHLCFS